MFLFIAGRLDPRCSSADGSEKLVAGSLFLKSPYHCGNIAVRFTPSHSTEIVRALQFVCMLNFLLFI